MNTKYATYLRVSTQKQGRTMLGIAAQRKMCADFIEQHEGQLDKEFLDVESGTHRDRKGLWQAIEHCKNNNMPLVIAKLDRLARDVEFVFKVVNSGIQIHFTDMPVVNTMILGVFAAVAQYERELTSERTKKALAELKKKGVKLGAAADNYHIDTEKAKERGQRAGETRTRRTMENRDTVAFIRIMKAVFPKCKENKESEWREGFVGTRLIERRKVCAMMRDYRAIDERLFASWDLSDADSAKFQHKLAGRMQSIIKILQRQ